MNTLQWLLCLGACVFGLAVTAVVLDPPRNRTGLRGHMTPAGAAQPEHDQLVEQRGIPVDAPGAYNLAPGPYEVRLHEFVLPDALRNKYLPLRVYVPTPKPNVRLAEARLPLVIFSHGAGGSREVGAELLSHWASHGYVVVAPTHADSIALQRAAGERPDMDETLASLALPVNRANRVGDCVLILDSLAVIEREIPELTERIDGDRAALAGHSAGAMTTMLATGVRGRLDTAAADGRFDCALVLSGQGVGRGGLFTKQSWDSWSVPALVATGSLDSSSRTGQTAEGRREPYELAPADSHKYMLWIEGAAHQSFTGGLHGEPSSAAQRRIHEYLEPGGEIAVQAAEYDQVAIFQVVQCATLAFLDAYLKSDQAARDYLAGDSLPALLPGVDWLKK